MFNKNFAPGVFKIIAFKVALAVYVSILLLSACDNNVEIDYSGPVDDWRHVGQNITGQRFSKLTQITPDNVDALQLAWQYNHGDFSWHGEEIGASTFEVTPLLVNGTLYFCTPFNRVIALDPVSGQKKWAFDPETDLRGVYAPNCRGVTYAQDTAVGDTTEPCARRIYVGTLDARLVGIDANTGKKCEDFGNKGEVNLLEGLGDVRQGEYYMTSPAVIVNDKLITGAFVDDGQRVDAPSGAVRAFDARSGELIWAWDPVGPGRTPITADDIKAGEILTPGTPNAWGMLSADPERGVIYVPTGNPSPDHYAGAERGDRDYYGTSVVALDIETGLPQWNFKTTNHDIWDYDVAAQPVSFSQQRDGELVPGVIAATKLGHIYLLDSRSGEPLFPVEQRPVPATDVLGEWTAKTQPFPTAPPPLHRVKINREDIWGMTPIDKGDCLAKYDALDHEGVYTPPSLKGTMLYPGLGGGVNWGSVSVDPVNNIMVVNNQVNAATVQLFPRSPDIKVDAGHKDLEGTHPQEGTPYIVKKNLMLSKWGTPCVPPPWGSLFAIDLNKGEILWQRPLGNLNDLEPFGLDALGLGKFFEWGAPNSGGSIQTASGLIFIASTMDKYFRAFDTKTGEELWRYELPFAGHATPMTYRVHKDGKQYVVIAAGGHGGLGMQTGDALMAFSLPD
jgi:quinoprotein glucose dehydrogenase